MNDRKFQVLMTAQRLFVEKGFASTSIQDILDESQISKGTFYNYFTSKNECLMAILDYAYQESVIRRRELLVGKNLSDKDVLTDQIIVRMTINRAHNLMPIFEAVLYSGDEELRRFVKTLHMDEVSWLIERLVDVYGEKARRFAPDCAIILHGMIQQLLHFLTFSSKSDATIETLVHFTMRRTDAIMADIIEKNETFLGNDLQLQNVLGIQEKQDVKKSIEMALSEILCLLKKDALPSSLQYAQFLYDEMQLEHPRIFIIESISRAFRESVHDTKYSQHVNEISSSLWTYIDKLKKVKKPDSK